MYQVGLTGGIAAGKSTVVDRLSRVHGLRVVDADVLARTVVAPGTPGLAAVVEAFGEGVLAQDGTLDRQTVGALVFGNPQRRRILEGIIHPLIAAERARLIATSTEPVMIHDIPLLFETGMADEFDEIVVVHCPAVIRVQRLIHDRGMAADAAWQRVHAQVSDEERLARADTILDNSQQREALESQVDALASRLKAIGS